MRFKNRNINVLLAAVCLASCGAQPIVHYQNMDAAAFEQASSSNMSPQQACEAASVAIARGHKTGLQFYSPLHLQHAIDNLEEGQGLIKVRETQTHGAKKCYKSAKFIKNGMAIKSKVGITLKNSLNELRLLKRVDVKNKYSDDIKDFADDVKDLVKLIEGDKISEAIQGQTELLREMLDLEVEIITDIHLSPVEDMLEKAEDINAEKLAEKTYEKAEIALEKARGSIRSNYRNKKQVEKVSAMAMSSARHAFYVAQEVETVKDLKEEAAEDKVLYMESLLARINSKVSGEAVTGHSLYDQSNIISQRIESLLNNSQKVNEN